MLNLEKKRAALRDMLLQQLPESGDYPTPIEGFMLYRYNNGDAPTPRFYSPVIIVVVQGKKWVRIGAKDLYFGEQTCFIAGVSIPVTSCIIEAAENKPFLSMTLCLDKTLIATLAAKVPPPAEYHTHPSTGAGMQKVTIELLDAFLRLLELIEKPEHDVQVLGSLLSQEIHYRLLTSSFGDQLRTLNTLGSQSNQISQAIIWLKDNYKKQLQVEELACHLNMATSTFHKHFKDITTISPLQYQKRLRLGEAQRLMLSDKFDVTQAAFAVGYESVTQFNREYKRLFGESPRKDITKTKKTMNRG